MPKDASTTSAATPMSYDSFKPKFPLDPFTDAGVPTPREPWSVDTDNLPSLPLLQAERKVILIIGQPSTNALEPFLHSLHLASSLLIIASHRPCPLPDTFQPAIRVLRLRTPIAVEDAGASRLVDVLEWAEQSARLWRKNGGLRYQELMEELESFGSLRNQQVAGRLRFSVVDAPIPGSSPVSPLSSQNSLQLKSNKMSKSSGNINGLNRASMFSMPSSDPEQRPFDAIIHFMPNKIPDKMLLKAAILVTTLTRPYVVTAAPRAPATRFWSENARMSTTPDSKSLGGNSNNGNGNTGKRWSFLRGSRSAANSTLSVNDPTKIEKRDRLGSNTSVLSRTASTFSNTSTTRTLANYMLRARKSRIIHILPSSPSRTSNAPAYSQQAQAQGEARLIRSIEAFLLSFSFPIPTSTLSPMDPDFQRARPYLIPAGALSDVLSLSPSPSSPVEGKEAETTMFQGEWTLAELVLSGALDLPYGPEVQAANALANGGILNAGEKGGLGEKGRSGMSDTAKGKMKDLGFSMAYDWMAHRAWIAGVHEVVVRPGGEANLSPPARAQVRQRPALPAPSSAPAVVTVHTARNPSPTKAHRSPLTTSQQQQSPVKGQAQTSPVKTRPTVSTSQTTPMKSSTSPTKSPSSPVSSPTRSRAPGAQAATLSPDKRLPTPPEELPQARKAAASTTPASSANVNHGSTSAVATAYLSPNYVASKARAGSDSGGSKPRPSSSAAPVTVSPYPSRIPAHSHGQKHASSPLAVSTSSRPADGQVRRRETTKRDRDREATFGLPTPPDSDEASAENIPIVVTASSPQRSNTSRIASSSSTNVSTVAVVGDQRRSRSAHGHEHQSSTSRPRAHTESRPRIESVPSQASQTSQSSTIPPTPPAKPAPLKRDSRQQEALARPSTSSGGNSQAQSVAIAAPAPAQKRTISRATDDAHKKILRRHSKHLGQLGHNRTASNSSPALVGSSLESDLSSSPELHRKRSKWKFWK